MKNKTKTFKQYLKENVRFEAGFKVGDLVIMTEDALENYGEANKEAVFEITSVATSTEEHPGYDEGMDGMGLCDLKNSKTGEEFGSSLYDFELELA